jgi:nicotinamidase-related amidase
MPIRALVLIDLQNEFLSPGGRFQIHGSSKTVVEHIPTLVRAFRKTRGPVFWIRSEYSRQPTPVSDAGDDYLFETHSGRHPCCEKNSDGARFPESIQALITESSQPENIIITKTWLSAFKETTLLEDLQSRGVTELYVGGLLTNVCVRATVMEAQARQP